MKTLKLSILLFGLLAFTGCSTENDPLLDENTKSNITTDITDNPSIFFERRPSPTIFADCIKYYGIVVPASFKPTAGNFDELYMNPNGTFADGVNLISDSKPGDQDYNGGRWHVNILRDDIDPNMYANACSDEDLNLEHFISTDNYFECPLIPYRP